MENAERHINSPDSNPDTRQPSVKLVADIHGMHDRNNETDDYDITPTETDLAENLEKGLDHIQSVLNTKVDWDVTEAASVKSFWQEDGETLEKYKQRLEYKDDVQGKMCALLGQEIYLGPNAQDKYFSELAKAAVKVCADDPTLVVKEILKTLDNPTKTGDIYNVYGLALATTEGRDISDVVTGDRYGFGEEIQKGPLFMNAVRTIETLNRQEFIKQEDTEGALLEVIKRGSFNWAGDNQDLNDRKLIKSMVEGGINDREYFGMDEYDDSQAIFEAMEILAEIGSEQCVQPILDYIKQSEPNRIYYAARTLSKAAPEKAAQILLKDLKSESVYENVLAEKLLLNLELGKIGISGEGVQYLNQLYDLDIFNKKGSFVQRLTNKGEIGVFDENSELMVYFPLQLDGSDSQDNIQAKIMKFTYESLFLPKADETEEERAERERILTDFKAKFSEVYLSDFEDKTGVSFNSFSLHEQGWFLEYMNDAPEQEKERAYDFIKEYGHDGLKAFLVMGYGSGNSEIILNLYDIVDKKEYGEILGEFSRIVVLAEEFRDLSEKSIDGSEQFPVQVHEAIMRRAKDLFLAMDTVNSHGNVEYSNKDIKHAFQAISYATSSITDIFKDNVRLVQSQKNADNSENRCFINQSGDKINVFVRPEASHEGQARINFAIKPNNPHLKELFSRTEMHQDRETKRSDIRIAFDLDVDRAGNVRGFSMDTGRSPYTSEIYSREGDVLGKLLEVSSKHKSHNYDSFDPELSDPETFSNIAEALVRYLDTKYAK